MPRPIHVPQDQPGISSYTLSPSEEFSVLAVTFSLVPLGGAGGDTFAYLDYRDPAGGIIYSQVLAGDDGGPIFYSLAPEAEPFGAQAAVAPAWPQSQEDWSYGYVTQRLSPQTLYAGCTINAYKPVGYIQPPTDPITAVSSLYSIPDLHLWVEDSAASIAQSNPATVTVGPYMLVPGLSA